MKNITEMLKGVLDGCILEIISHEEIYRYEITKRLNALGFSDVVDGTIYTILVRLRKNKLVEITKKKSDIGSPRKFFPIILSHNTLLYKYQYYFHLKYFILEFINNFIKLL